MTEDDDTDVREWRFLRLMLGIAGWMLIAPHLPGRWHVQVLLQGLLLYSMLVTLWANPQWLGIRRAVVAFWFLSLAGAILGMVPLPEGWQRWAYLADLASPVPLLGALSAGILLFVFRSRHVGGDGIFATIVVYLLIAMLFAQVYLVAINLDPSSFVLPYPVDGRPARLLQGDMHYFSLVTLATVGYGDIVPRGETTRMLAMFEAVVGQFYVAVIVAVFVGMHMARRRD